MKSCKQERNNDGYVALITILILSFVSIVLATTFTELSIGEGQASRSQLVGEDSAGLVESCANEILYQVSQPNGDLYQGTNMPVILPEGTCLATVTRAPNGTQLNNYWSFIVISPSTGYVQRLVEGVFIRGTEIYILNWILH